MTEQQNQEPKQDQFGPSLLQGAIHIAHYMKMIALYMGFDPPGNLWPAPQDERKTDEADE